MQAVLKIEHYTRQLKLQLQVRLEEMDLLSLQPVRLQRIFQLPEWQLSLLQSYQKDLAADVTLNYYHHLQAVSLDQPVQAITSYGMMCILLLFCDFVVQ
jgi:hypothetical protein